MNTNLNQAQAMKRVFDAAEQKAAFVEKHGTNRAMWSARQVAQYERLDTVFRNTVRSMS